MSEKIQLQIVTPDREAVAGQVDEVVLPSVQGSMGVLAGHAPLLARLDVGEVSYRTGNQRHYLAISGGFAEVLRDSVSILAETCEPAEEIDLERAERSRKTAEDRLGDDPDEDEFAKAELRLKRAINRISTHGRARGMMS